MPTLLTTACANAIDHRWYGTRTAASNAGQLRFAVDTLLEVVGSAERTHTRTYNVTTIGGKHTRPVLGLTKASLTVEEITTEHLKACVAVWRKEGLSASTINTRLNIFSALGINVKGARVVRPKPLKWWLPPDKMAELLVYLRAPAPPFPRARFMADYVEWTCFTGLRVEETLRLTWDEVRLDIREEGSRMVSHSEMVAPGTKTTDAQASLALALIPALLLKRRFEERENPREPRIFAVPRPTGGQPIDDLEARIEADYDRLSVDWAHPRAFLGATDNKLATLKALRRTAARHLTVNGMPTAILMGYLRHSNIQTTMGYLRLTGGYSTTEQRRWL